MSVENALQNDFLNQLRKNATPVSVFLTNGDRLDGRIKSFDIYSISLDGPETRLIVKTVIATIQPASKGAKKAKAVPRVQLKPYGPRPERKEPEIHRKKRRVTLPRP